MHYREGMTIEAGKHAIGNIYRYKESHFCRVIGLPKDCFGTHVFPVQWYGEQKIAWVDLHHAVYTQIRSPYQTTDAAEVCRMMDDGWVPERKSEVVK